MFLRHTINKHIYRTVAPETSRNNAAEVRLTERRLRTLKPKTDTTIKKNGFKRNKNIKTLKNWQKELAEKLDKQNKSLKFHMSEMFGQIEEPQNLKRFNVSTPTVDDLKKNSANGNFTYWDAKWMQIQAGRGDRLEIKPHEADIHSTEIPPFNLVVDKSGQIKTNEQLAQVHNLSEDETKLMKIEQKLEGLKAEITSFAGVRSDNKFYELDETMMRLILLLDKLEINDQILRQRKKYLLKKIHKLSKELDCRAQQKELLKREKNLKTISKSLEVPHQNEEDIEKAKLYVKNIEKQREQITVNNENLMVDNDFHEGLQILEKEMKNQMLKYMHPLKECRRSSATIDHFIQQTGKLLIIEKKLKRVIDWLQIPQKISDDIERVNDCLKNIAKEIAQFDSYDGHHELYEYCVRIYFMVCQRIQIFRAKLESDLNKRKGLTYITTMKPSPLYEYTKEKNHFKNYSYRVSNPPRNSRTIDNVAKSNAQRANTITTDGRLGSFNNSKNGKQHDIIPGEFNELGQHLAKTPIPANRQDLLEMKSAELKSVREVQEELQKLRSTEKEESKTEEHRQRLNEVEDKLEALKPEIFSFVGVQSDKKFNELDGTVLGLILLLDRLEINDECLRKRKKCLLKNIHKLGKELDLRAQQEEFLNGKEKLKIISNWLETQHKNEEDIDKAKSYIKSSQKLLEPMEAFSLKNNSYQSYSYILV
ncbi:uncharacterized protein LOC143194841 [Rhynchophorus ferrugineus]|uniref:uncharacterized protein LOC143194841 n=1 Tax=Rhynchophorus ferrugineus TaxID=354439 RepID=UPI003FCDBB2E